MKTTNQRWNINLGLLLLSAAAGTVWAVNPDQASPCWRDAANSSRQVWTFDTTNSFGAAIASSFKTNQPGNPTATLTKGNLGIGWYDTGCGGPCGTVVYAVLPLNPPLGDGPPYESVQFGFGQPYVKPPATGDAQGFWDMGGNLNGNSNRLALTIPNNGAPAGTIRYFIAQGTYAVASGVASLPAGYAVNNGVGAAGVRVGSAVNTTVEQPLDANGDLTPTAWRNQRVVLRVAAVTAAGSDTITITNPTAFWVDAMIVETLDRVAVNDVLNAVQNTVTNIPFAQLLANDRGGNLITVGTAFGGSVVTNPGNIVIFTPSNGFSGAATFWYTNRDCTLYTNLGAQVTVNIAAVINPLVANPDNYNRPKGTALKIKISDLLTNDSDSDGYTISFVGQDSATTNNKTLFNNGTYIFVPANSVADRFGYTIHDNHLGTNSGYVFIAATSSTGQPATVTPTPSNATVIFYGIPGTNYVVERTTNIGVFSGAGYSNFGTVPAASDGAIQVKDNFSDIAAPPTPASAFYRLVAP